jgi:hypothetical protein
MANEEIIATNSAELDTKLDNFATVEEMIKWAETIIESGLLPRSIVDPSQVITIVSHGKELGLSPHVALNNIHVIQGRPTVSSAMLGALLKKHGVEWIVTKDYEKLEDDKHNVIDRITEFKFFWKSKVTGTILEAKHSVSWSQLTVAGYTSKENYTKYPKEMMRARCLSSSVRALFPEVLMGLYTDLEINDIAPQSADVTVTEEGEVILEPVQ